MGEAYKENEWCPSCVQETIPRMMMGRNACYFCDSPTKSLNPEPLVPDHIEGGLDYTMNIVFAATTLMHAGDAA